MTGYCLHFRGYKSLFFYDHFPETLLKIHIHRTWLFVLIITWQSVPFKWLAHISGFNVCLTQSMYVKCYISSNITYSVLQSEKSKKAGKAPSTSLLIDFLKTSYQGDLDILLLEDKMNFNSRAASLLVSAIQWIDIRRFLW